MTGHSPAYPVLSDHPKTFHPGLSKRERLACEILAGLVSRPDSHSAELEVRRAVRYADLLLAELAQTKGETP